MSYYLAPSLAALGVEVTQLWKPTWPTVSIGDGWVGDTSHSARESDHNPDWDSNGVVRAVDIGIEGRDGDAILKAVIGDPRVWYVIHKGTIWSRTTNWAPRLYTGSNQHTHHIHVSIVHTSQAEGDTSPWLEEEDPMAGITEGDIRKIVRDEVRNGLGFSNIIVGKKDGELDTQNLNLVLRRLLNDEENLIRAIQNNNNRVREAIIGALPVGEGSLTKAEVERAIESGLRNVLGSLNDE